MASAEGLERILVPVDFSEGSLQALERALQLPLKGKPRIEVVHALPDDIPGRLRKEAIAEAGRSLEKLLSRVRAQVLARQLSPRQVTVDVLEGDPTKEIVKRARTLEAEVIVIGRHGRRTLSTLLIGSTARKVVKTGDVPVLLVRAPARQPYQRALIAVDLSRGSARQLKSAAPFVSAAEVTVMHASSIPYADFVLVPQDDAEKARGKLEKSAAKDLRKLVQKSPLEGATPRVIGGDARLLIAQEATLLQSELVVVATHGGGGLKRLVLGSVAEWVMSHCECDVLVTRA